MQSKGKNAKLKVQNFLREIKEKKRDDLLRKIRIIQKSEVSDVQTFRKSYPLSFIESLTRNNKKRVGLIAEIKFASPINPHLGSRDTLLVRAKHYEQVGAEAISIITEKHYFNGDVSFVSQVKEHVTIPVLQKDFVIDSCQIYEAKKVGSDALLLIARLVDTKTLNRFVKLCFAEEIEPVVEVTDEEDLEKAVASTTKIIAVNARDLETLAIDVAKACLLLQKIPGHFIKLGFSGIHSAKEVKQYKNAGVNGVLVGTSLMQAKNIAEFIKELKI